MNPRFRSITWICTSVWVDSSLLYLWTILPISSVARVLKQTYMILQKLCVFEQDPKYHKEPSLKELTEAIERWSIMNCDPSCCRFVCSPRGEQWGHVCVCVCARRLTCTHHTVWTAPRWTTRSHHTRHPRCMALHLFHTVCCTCINWAQEINRSTVDPFTFYMVWVTYGS